MAEGALRETELEDDDMKWKAQGENDSTEDFELDLTQAEARKIVKGGNVSPDYVAESNQQGTQEDRGENALGWPNPFDIAQDKLQEHGPGYILKPAKLFIGLTPFLVKWSKEHLGAFEALCLDWRQLLLSVVVLNCHCTKVEAVMGFGPKTWEIGQEGLPITDNPLLYISVRTGEAIRSKPPCNHPSH
ncbi:hypothetical protein Ancab_032460 [Ancistrocladus abbreviatus]